MRLNSTRSIVVMMMLCAAPVGAAKAQAANTLTAAQSKAGWRLLFDGVSAGQWRGYRSDSLPAGWHVENGTLTKSGSTGDLLTREPFANFELDLDWKIGPAGNSGIFYRATEEYDEVYWSGPEYQLLDDAAAPDGKNRLTSAGAAYGIYPSPAGIVKPAGEWNSTRIIVRGNHVEHWLNGTRLLEYELGSADWKTRVAASKFAVWHDYGRASAGYIGIQGDHNGSLSLRNIRILAR
ncbi:MAG: 3-keto-disaccharide hydrolase [Gemmatimonadales bacterium]